MEAEPELTNLDDIISVETGSSSPSPNLLRPPSANKLFNSPTKRGSLTPDNSCRTPPQTPSDVVRLQKEAVRLAKLQNTTEKASKVAELKEKWAKEKEAKLITMNDRRTALQKFIVEASEKESEIRKMRSAMKREDDRKKLETEQELFESAALDKAYSTRELDRIEKEKRRHSLMLNKEMMRQFREKEAEIDIVMKEEEAKVLEARRTDYLNARDAEYAEEDRKRENLFAKGKVHQEHRVIDVEEDKVKLEVRNDIIDFRRTLSLARAEQEREDEENRRNEFIFRGKEAQVQRNITEMMNRAKHDEEIDVLNFRRELALHKIAKDREEAEARRQSLIENGEIFQEDRRTDALTEKAKMDEERDILNFRHEIAVHKSQRDLEASAERRQSLFRRGEVAQEDRRIEELLEKARQDEERDILNFRYELALSKAAKEKADAAEVRQAFFDNGEVVQEDRRTDERLEKERQDENRDILNFRREIAVAKAAKDKSDAATRRNSFVLRGEVAKADRITDGELERARQDEGRDIHNFRHEIAVTKAAKEKADADHLRDEFRRTGLVAQEDRRTDERLEKERQDEGRDIHNFRHEIAVTKAAKEKADADHLRDEFRRTGLVAQEDRRTDERMEKARQDEGRDIHNFRHEIAVTKAAKLKADADRIRDEFIQNGVVAREDRLTDAEFAAARQEEGRDMHNFRHELAVTKAAKAKADADEIRNDFFQAGVVAKEDRITDAETLRAQQDEGRDIMNFRRELAIAKAAKAKADADHIRNEFIKSGEVAQEDRRTDERLERERQDEGRDIHNFRHELAVMKAAKAKADADEIRNEFIRSGEVAKEDRVTDAESLKAKQDEGRDMHNFRHELAVTKAAKLKADADEIRNEFIQAGVVAQEDRRTDERLEKERQDEGRDIHNFRHEIAVTKAAKEKADADHIRNEFIKSGEVAQEDRRTDERLEKERQEAGRDMHNFRHELAVTKAAKLKADADEIRNDFYQLGVVAREDRITDAESLKASQDEGRDIMNFRRELAIAKAAKAKADADHIRNEFIQSGEVAQENRRTDERLEKERQETSRDMHNFRLELAVMKAVKAKADADEIRNEFIRSGEVAKEDRITDAESLRLQQEAGRDMHNFRHELAVTKAAKEKADADHIRNEFKLAGIVAQEDRRTDERLEKERQDEGRDMHNFRHDLAVTKAAKLKADTDEIRDEFKLAGIVAQDDRRTDERLEKERQDEGRDMHNFRHELAVMKADKAKADADEIRNEFTRSGEVAKEDRVTDAESLSLQQEEGRDMHNFRHELAVTKAAKAKADADEIRNDFFQAGVVAEEDRITDAESLKASQDAERDRLNFRHETALATIAKAKADADELRQAYYDGGLVAQEEKRIDQVLEKARQDEDRDILNFRYEMALAKAAKDKQDAADDKQAMITAGEVAREVKRIDELVEKARQDEDRDVLNFRYEIAVAKAEKDKADADATRKAFYDGGLVAQEEKRIDEVLLKARQDEDRDVLNFRYEIALAKVAKETQDAKDEKQAMTLAGEVAREEKRIDELMEKARQDEDRDVLNFRHEIAVAKAEAAKAEADAVRLSYYNSGLVAQEDRRTDERLEMERQDENRDILNFRRETALAVAAKAKADADAIRLAFQEGGLVAQEEKRIDQLLEKARQDEDRDILNFRYEQALVKAAKDAADAAEGREIMFNKGVVAREEKRIDQLLEKARQDEDRDILNFRHELALAKAAKEKADANELKQGFFNRGLVVKEERRIDQLMEKARQDEDRDILNFRHEQALAKAAKDKADAVEARTIMHNNGLIAQEEKRIDLLMEKARQDEDRDILNFRHEQAVTGALKKRDDARAAREDLQERLNTWRIHKALDAEKQTENADIEKDLLESKRQNWLDLAADKRLQAKANKESLSSRLAEWRRQKALTKIEEEERTEAEDIEWQLKDQCAQDVKDYQASLNEERRESLQYRLQQARNDKDYNRGLKALQSAVAEEEKRIEEEDRTDVANYRKGIVNARRQSLIYRNQYEFQDRQRKEGENQILKASEEQERMRREEDWRNVKAAQEDQRAQIRKDLAERLAYERVARETEIVNHHHALAAMHEELQWKHCDWAEQQNEREIAEEKKRRATSIRMDSWKQERMGEERMIANASFIEEEEGRLREMDREDLLAAKALLKEAEAREQRD